MVKVDAAMALVRVENVLCATTNAVSAAKEVEWKPIHSLVQFGNVQAHTSIPPPPASQTIVRVENILCATAKNWARLQLFGFQISDTIKNTVVKRALPMEGTDQFR